MQQMHEERTLMRAVCVNESGKLDVKHIPRPEPKDGQLLIRVAATALNRADLLQKRGLYPPPPGESEILGLEASGVIADIGPGVKGNWILGSKVMALLGGGGYAEYVAVPEKLVMSVPSPLTLNQAAALPEAWLTAYQLLHFIAKVKPNETVLIHAGASGIGTAAIQLVRLSDAIPVVTAGSPEKLKFAEQMGAAAGINYKEEDFSEKVLQFTEGKGADVILDCVGGSFWEKNICSLAIDGRWVLYGMLGGKTADGDLLGKLLRKRGNLLCSLLRSRSLQYKAELVRSFTEQVLPHFQSTDSPLRPVIDSMFSLEDVEMAHEHMEANKNIGKIILKMGNS
ncbi:quinone oxidoreductase PIG3 [Labeo rohita]|uniref:Quinone oxidoreductase PIG3 n=2 Tax=Labeo rohita TaxID=84645 RepID=A0A498NF23_LABRO|nr:quinone oxidoreductase PIG3 [Labeo rohita]XP_050988675.1 quinone oxidoreductase PIG3 [Labeo rohita]RXN29327.1 quinone oxidoreductase PIG3 [Labeo rohita]